jgi:hypothetical protein
VVLSVLEVQMHMWQFLGRPLKGVGADGLDKARLFDSRAPKCFKTRSRAKTRIFGVFELPELRRISRWCWSDHKFLSE